MPQRFQSAGKYRFGFNGKEKDDEVKGSGNSVNYKARIYDPRIGKFLSVDPLTLQFPWYSPYQFAGNKPIVAIDLDGLEELNVVNYLNERGNLYRTEITVVNVFKKGQEATNTHQLVHRTTARYDAAGNIVYQYAGTTLNSLTATELRAIRRVITNASGQQDVINVRNIGGKVYFVNETFDGTEKRLSAVDVPVNGFTGPPIDPVLQGKNATPPNIEDRHDGSGNPIEHRGTSGVQTDEKGPFGGGRVTTTSSPYRDGRTITIQGTTPPTSNPTTSPETPESIPAGPDE